MGLNRPVRSTYRALGLHITVSSGYTCARWRLCHCVAYNIRQASHQQCNNRAFLVFSAYSGSGFRFSHPVPILFFGFSDL